MLECLNNDHQNQVKDRHKLHDDSLIFNHGEEGSDSFETGDSDAVVCIVQSLLENVFEDVNLGRELFSIQVCLSEDLEAVHRELAHLRRTLL